jgi:hypothetical protein
MRYFLILILAASGAAQQGSSHKEAETTVRTAYAKLSYADEVRIILGKLQDKGRDQLWKTRATLADPDLNARLAFGLADFRFGKIEEIADRKISEFDGALTQVGGEVLDVTPSIYNYSTNGAMAKYVAYVKFSWKPSEYSFLPAAEDWTIARALKDDAFEGKTYTDYATYTVTLTFNHKSRTYATWVLFGRDENKKLQIYFMDRVVDPTALTFALEHSLYPAAFVETDLHTVPFVEKWLYDNARSCSAKSEKDDGRQDICCDSEGRHCGVASSALLPRDSGKNATAPAKALPVSFHASSLRIHHSLMQTTGPAGQGCGTFSVGTTFPMGLATLLSTPVDNTTLWLQWLALALIPKGLYLQALAM